jgi:hypothetical protein
MCCNLACHMRGLLDAAALYSACAFYQSRPKTFNNKCLQDARIPLKIRVCYRFAQTRRAAFIHRREV